MQHMRCLYRDSSYSDGCVNDKVQLHSSIEVYYVRCSSVCVSDKLLQTVIACTFTDMAVSLLSMSIYHDSAVVIGFACFSKLYL